MCFAIHELYWRDHDQSRAVSQEVFDTHELLVMQADEFAIRNAHLAHLDRQMRELAKRTKTTNSFAWETTPYTAVALENAGFRRVRRSSIGVVDDGVGRAYVVFVYTRNIDALPVLVMGAHTLGKDDRVLRKDTAGQSETNKRGAKLQTGRMLMYGSQANYGANTEPGANPAHHPSVYLPNGKPDVTLNACVRRLAAHCTAIEAAVTPAIAQYRRDVADLHDPTHAHRMTDGCDAFSMSCTSSYVVQPHDDSGVVNECVLFANRTGPLPPGHEWTFVVGGHLLALPNMLCEGALVTLPGHGVEHGTLPTSSTAPSLRHGNLGCAMVTNKRFLEACAAQAARGETTATQSGLRHTASVLYASTN